MRAVWKYETCTRAARNTITQTLQRCGTPRGSDALRDAVKTNTLARMSNDAAGNEIETRDRPQINK